MSDDEQILPYPRCSLLLNGGERVDIVPGKTAAEAPGVACPECGVPLIIQGAGMHIAADDRSYEATGACVACRKPVGTIRAEVQTLFGLTEDRAVLHGRPRVY